MVIRGGAYHGKKREGPIMVKRGGAFMLIRGGAYHGNKGRSLS